MLKPILGLYLFLFVTSCWYTSRRYTLTRDCLWMFSYASYSNVPTHSYRFYKDGTLDYYAFCNDSLKKPEYPCKVGRNPDRPPRWNLNDNDSIYLDGFWFKIREFNADSIVLTNTSSDRLVLTSDFESLKKMQ